MSGAPVEIPLIAAAQTFSVTLNGVTYTMTLSWCAPASCWMLDIGDINNNPIITAIPLITGADLLEAYTDCGIGGQLWVQTDNDADEVPTYDNLGTLGHLYFVPAT